jgi:hypothetical protein
MAATANDGWMLPEQVWDRNPPAGAAGFAPGDGTGSATPLTWTHAQFVRLAWSIDAGRPVERPTPVSCRYETGCEPGPGLTEASTNGRTRSSPASWIVLSTGAAGARRVSRNP